MQSATRMCVCVCISLSDLKHLYDLHEIWHGVEPLEAIPK